MYMLNASFQAAEDSLHQLYLTRTPRDMLSLPTDTFADGASFLDAGANVSSYMPRDLGELEVIYASKDR